MHLRNSTMGRVAVWLEGAPVIDVAADTTTGMGGYDSLYVGVANGSERSGRIDVDELRVARMPIPCAP